MQSSIVLIVVLALSNCHSLTIHNRDAKATGGLTANHLAEQCYQKWYHVRQGTMTDDQANCLRIKVASDCMARKTVDSSRVLDESRFLTEQDAIFSNKHGKCKPTVDVSKLTKMVELSGIKDKYKDIIVDNDEPAQCAAESYEECLAQYNKLYPNGKMCQDAGTFIKCLEKKAKTCKAEIFQHIEKIYKIAFGGAMDEASAKFHRICVRE